ncbi:hypothetical protein QUF75_13870 [Desulfococcaceae bacterium HSG7]|nr:hypothetical protein [Desulfococcaceae bacterium HSG7]
MEPITMGIIIGTWVFKTLAITTAVTVVGAAVCWAVEKFAEKVAVKARARSLRRFFVSVLRTTWNVVKLVAKTVNNVTLMTDSMSYSDYPESLEYDKKEKYEFKV